MESAKLFEAKTREIHKAGLSLQELMAQLVDPNGDDSNFPIE
jgi:hypothetical protein